jgi:hypothetical protein
MAKIKCKRTAYHNLPQGQLDTPAVAVKNGIYSDNVTFPTPPITELAFQGFIDNFVTTYGIYQNGGSGQRGNYNLADIALTNAMDTMATYVDNIANGDVNIITNAGFVATKGTPSEAPAPVIIDNVVITRGNPGQLLVECKKQAYVDSYICILTPNEPTPANMIVVDGQIVLENDNGTTQPLATVAPAAVIDFNKTRKKKFAGLTSGTTYYATMFGINAQGVGDLSEPVSKMCW